MRPMTAAGHMRDMHGFMLQLRDFLTARAPGGAAAAYSPLRSQLGSRRGYAAELADQQRSFRHLEETLVGVGAEPEQEGM